MAERTVSVRVLGIVGSPRRGGNTEALVDEVLAGAEEKGAATEKVILSELDISPCKACDRCLKGVCAQKDDMKGLLDRMQKSHVWVLGTPVYWWGPTAQFKAFLDRWYGAKKVKFKGRPVVVTIALGATSSEVARHTIGMLTDSLNYLAMNIVDTIVAAGVQERGEVRSLPRVLARARRAGTKAAAIGQAAAATTSSD
ncbi:MAG: hypothetical protein C4K49_11635 [Candidatus Thorarchaeota archaeon]|nr:MAG: hypothetical protein C4K49_11635 [Candidatus Thorarchaeota archaeon]